MTQTLTGLEIKVLKLLRENLEGSRETDAAGNTWADTYLPNAQPVSMSSRQFDGTLASLKGKGLYRPIDGDCFGVVRLA